MNTGKTAKSLFGHWGIETIGLEAGISPLEGRMNEIALVINLAQNPLHDSSVLDVIEGAIRAMVPGILNEHRFMGEFASLIENCNEKDGLLDEEHLQAFVLRMATQSAEEDTLDLISDRKSEAGVVLTLDPRDNNIPAIEVMSNRDGGVCVKVYVNKSDPLKANTALRPFIDKLKEGGLGPALQIYQKIAAGF